MRRNLNALVLVGMLATCAALAASGGASAATIEVHIKNAVFTPATVNIHTNDTVIFFNDETDTTAHDVTFQAGFASGAGGSLTPGTNWSHTFATAGTFAFRCTVHSTSFTTGMVGSVVVTAPGTAPPPPTPGFELPAIIAAIAAVALIARRRASA